MGVYTQLQNGFYENLSFQYLTLMRGHIQNICLKCIIFHRTFEFKPKYPSSVQFLISLLEI